MFDGNYYTILFRWLPQFPTTHFWSTRPKMAMGTSVSFLDFLCQRSRTLDWTATRISWTSFTENCYCSWDCFVCSTEVDAKTLTLQNVVHESCDLSSTSYKCMYQVRCFLSHMSVGFYKYTVCIFIWIIFILFTFLPVKPYRKRKFILLVNYLFLFHLTFLFRWYSLCQYIIIKIQLSFSPINLISFGPSALMEFFISFMRCVFYKSAPNLPQFIAEIIFGCMIT